MVHRWLNLILTVTFLPNVCLDQHENMTLHTVWTGEQVNFNMFAACTDHLDKNSQAN